MKKLSLQINELKFINEFFDGEMCLCGGVADFIYTGYDDISDLDILIKKSAFMRSMEINSMDYSSILKYSFNIEKIFYSNFQELTLNEHFYAGFYKHYPIDLFIVKNIDESVMFKSQNTTKKYGINVTSIEDRMRQCGNFLSTQETSDHSESSKKWLEKKKKQAKIKLELYQKKYPEIYNDLFYI